MSQADHPFLKEALRSRASEVGFPTEATKEARSFLLKEIRALTRSIVDVSSRMTQTQRQALLMSVVDESLLRGDYQSSVLLMAAGSQLSVRWPKKLTQSLAAEAGRQSQLFRYLFWLVVRRSA